MLVLIGGAVGSVWRYWWSGWIAERFGETFPYGTLVVNLVGSFVIGFAAEAAVHFASAFWQSAMKQFVVVGVCGGLTTFSSFSLQTFNLLRERRWRAALANIFVSTTLSLALVALGWSLGEFLLRP